MDVDGTLTDGKIYMGENGEIMKAFDIKDGFAIYEILPKNGIIPVIITGRTSQIVEMRCKELGITEIHQGCIDKKSKMLEVAEKYGLAIGKNGRIENSAYIGDDILDISGMCISEVSACPVDAANEVKNIATYICKRKGGDCALREFVDWLVENSADIT